MIQKLILGDCLEKMAEIPDEFVDLILCDLPYGTTACKWDIIIPFDKLWDKYERIISNNGCIALFGSEPFSSLLRASNLKMFKYDWIWEKSKGSNYVHAKFQPLKTHETISIFSKSPAAQNIKHWMRYFPQKTQGNPYVYGKKTDETTRFYRKELGSVSQKKLKTIREQDFREAFSILEQRKARAVFPRRKNL